MSKESRSVAQSQTSPLGANKIGPGQNPHVMLHRVNARSCSCQSIVHSMEAHGTHKAGRLLHLFQLVEEYFSVVTRNVGNGSTISPLFSETVHNATHDTGVSLPRLSSQQLRRRQLLWLPQLLHVRGRPRGGRTAAEM